jgi:hypothetical protein
MVYLLLSKFGLLCPVGMLHHLVLASTTFVINSFCCAKDHTCSEFIQLAKSLVGQLAIVGKLIEEEDLISYIVGGLNTQFNPFVTFFSFATKDTSMTLDDFQAEILSYEQLLDNQNTPHNFGSFALYSQKSNTTYSRPKFGNNNQHGQQRFNNNAARNSHPK